jgi:hypothetical protein
MFGPFRITNPLSGGLLWKIPWRLSKFQKRRHRLRLRAVDNVVATVDAALAKKGQTLEALERWKAEMPTEAEMLPRDKYTMFDRKERKYRKGIHSTLPTQVPLLTSFHDLVKLTGDFMQSCPSGRECHRESTLLVTSDDDSGLDDYFANGPMILPRWLHNGQTHHFITQAAVTTMYNTVRDGLGTWNGR